MYLSSAAFENLEKALARKPDYSYWAKHDIWTAEQAVLLFLDCDPAQVKPEISVARRDFKSSRSGPLAGEQVKQFLKDYAELVSLIKSAKLLNAAGKRVLVFSDSPLSNTRLEPICFLDWAENKELQGVPPELVRLVKKYAENEAGPMRVTDKAVLAKPLQRGEAMRQSILTALENLGYDPKAIPKNPSGKSGVRKMVREHLREDSALVSDRAFEKAWQALRNSGEIQDA